MSDAYLGEIRMFGGNYAPRNWAFCEGQLLPVHGHASLYSLIGTTYGGDGRTTFGLPDLRGRLAEHRGTDYVGTMKGFEAVTVDFDTMPEHIHPSASSNGGTSLDPTGNVLADTGDAHIYYKRDHDVELSSEAAVHVGASQPHTNLMPFLCVSYIICLDGMYPQRP